MDHCCAEKTKPTHNRWKVAAQATLHCMTGCVIGEFVGLSIGSSLGLHPAYTITLSTLLAYLSGFALTVFPLMKKTGLTFHAALKAVWLGEVVSIGVMELAMNTVDYHLGGMRSGGLTDPQFWKALAAAVAAGYLAALPVNAWLIGRQLKKCH